MEYSLLKDDKTLKSGYLLSPKDISTAEILDKVLATGVDSLKIEGRMKALNMFIKLFQPTENMLMRLWKMAL